jgi:citrate synthase
MRQHTSSASSQRNVGASRRMSTTQPTEPSAHVHGREHTIVSMTKIQSVPDTTPKRTANGTTISTEITHNSLKLNQPTTERHRCSICGRLCKPKNPSAAKFKPGRKRELWPHILEVLKTQADRQHPMRVTDITATVNEQFQRSYLLSAVSRSIRREMREGAPIREVREGKTRGFYWGGD